MIRYKYFKPFDNQNGKNKMKEKNVKAPQLKTKIVRGINKIFRKN